MDISSSEDKISPKILALIPAYNEADHIRHVIESTKKYIPVLILDDGSKDETSKIALDTGADVIRQEPNQGKGAALLRGFQYAIENNFDAVITLDADGQHDPDEIPLFMERFIDENNDLIIGKRNFRKMPFVRMCSNTFGTWFFSFAMKQYIPDNQSGYRLHSRRLIVDAISSSEHGFEFEVEIILRCVLEKYSISWIPIKTIYADEKSHIRPIHHIVNFFRITFRAGKLIRQRGV